MDETAREPRRGSRALALVAALCLGGAVVLGVAAWRAEATGRADTEAIEQPTPAVGPAPASTIAPLRPASPAASAAAPKPTVAADAGEEQPAPVPTTALARSPLADLLPPPAAPAASSPSPAPAPVGITIDGIGLRSAPVIPVGVLANGEFEVPGAADVGWYRYGARPGEPGATVLAAHVDWNGDPGRFLRLGRVTPGSQVVLQLADGSTRTYSVVERAVYDKRELPPDRVWTRTGPETLVLITCGGRFDSRIRHYKDNIVVFAVPVGATPPPPAAAP